MAKGSSQSQASSQVSRGGSGGPTTVGALPRGSNAASGVRRRRTSICSGSARGGFGRKSNNMLRFHADDAPGLKITPTFVLVMSLCFIGFVTALHVIGRLYRWKSVGA